VAVFHKREKIVSFRVSEEEYESLRAASEVQGAHSISEYARRAACGKEPPAPPADFRQVVENLRSRVDELQDQMRRMARRMDELT